METTQTEVKKENKESVFKKPWVQSLIGIIIILLLAGGALFFKTTSSRISIDNSIISAPEIAISPEAGGILDQVYVKDGDTVTAGQSLARVGGEVLSAKVAGIVINVSNTPGQVFSTGQPVVTMIDPTELRVVGTIKETDGLADIKVGDPASFTIDAYGSKTFAGLVDSISVTSNTSGVAFSISDQRPVREFDVKVKYDVAANPEFKNGMSAKMQIYKSK